MNKYEAIAAIATAAVIVAILAVTAWATVEEAKIPKEPLEHIVRIDHVILDGKRVTIISEDKATFAALRDHDRIEKEME